MTSDRAPFRISPGSSTPPRGRVAACALRWWVLTLVLACLWGCASTEPAPDRRGLPESDRAWLLPPLEEYDAPLSTEARLEISRAYRVLVDESQREVARSVARSILAGDEDNVPAHVLMAQVDFLDRRYDLVVERLVPALEDVPPGYRAGQLLLAYAAEEQADVLTAFMAYEDVAFRSPRAARNAERLHDEAVQIARLRFEEALDSGDVDAAVDWLENLDRWRPGDPDNLELQGMLAAAQEDGPAQLAVFRRLAASGNPSRALLERWADLEVRYGEARTGLNVFKDLAARYPDDPSLVDRVAEATFAWSFDRLPVKVRELRQKEELTRADLATLLYWNVRQIRSVAGHVPQLADDAIDHPRSQEIIRVLSYGVMSLDDQARRRFAPDKTATRQDLLGAMLRVGKIFGEDPCTEDLPASEASDETVCTLATRCGVLLDIGNCLAGAPVSGPEAVELLRRGLTLLEG